MLDIYEYMYVNMDAWIDWAKHIRKTTQILLSCHNIKYR